MPTTLLDQVNLSNQPAFQQQVAAGAVSIALNVMSEAVIDQQTISMGAVTAGTFTLTFLGQTTPAQQWNSSAITIQTALNALTTITSGGVECTGGPLPGTPIVVNFIGTNLIGPQPLLTHTDTLTGGVATVTHTTLGVWVLNHAKRAALAKSILVSPASYGVSMAMAVANASAVQADFPAPNYAMTSTAAQATTDITNQISAIFNDFI